MNLTNIAPCREFKTRNLFVILNECSIIALTKEFLFLLCAKVLYAVIPIPLSILHITKPILFIQTNQSAYCKIFHVSLQPDNLSF